MSKVIFVSYDGEYPDLCSGELILCVNGKIYSSVKLSSGGFCEISDDEELVGKGAWDIAYAPKELADYLDEIRQVVNENIEWGCCGGCI